MTGRVVHHSGNGHRTRGLHDFFGRVSGHLRHERQRLLRPIQRWYRGCRQAAQAEGVSGLLRHLRQRGRIGVLRAFGLGQSEDEIAAVSMNYWNEGDKAGVNIRDYSHWAGAGPWIDREKWLALGRVHHDLYERSRNALGLDGPLQRVVEWGCGGGANAVHFCREVASYCGIDIAQASVDECGRVLREEGFAGFQPVLIPAEDPEQALRLVGAPCDLFLCTYVFELLPGRRYGERVCRIAYDLLKPGGLALIQIRYDDGSDRTNQKNIDYYRYACRFTSYRVEEFWILAQKIGFVPQSVFLVPEKTTGFSGDRYAYFALQRPVEAATDKATDSARA